MSDNEVYYKIYRQTRKPYLMTVVCMQWFDEWDYEERNFVRDADGCIYRFSDEEEAIGKLNEWYKQEQIDPEYRRALDSDLIR